MEERPKPILQTDSQHGTEKPIIHDTPPVASPSPKGSKSLLIALIVSAVFLIAAAVLAFWLVTKPANSTTVPAQTGDGSSEVKKIEFVAPQALPANYVKRVQNTVTAQLTYYTDGNTDCGFTTVVQPLVAGKNPKDLATATTQTDGITTTNSTGASGFTIKDVDTKHSYNFLATQLDQNVALLGVAFNAQHSVVAYKQFNTSVASVTYSCRADTWDSKKAELAQLAATFSVKTER